MERLSFDNAQEWRAWLHQHHASSPGVSLLLRYKKIGKVAFSYEEAVEEALCYGWVNGSSGKHEADSFQKVDSDTYSVAFSPRKEGSRWSAANRKRAHKLIADNRMTESGLAKIEHARQDGLWFQGVEPHVTPIALLGIVVLYLLGSIMLFSMGALARSAPPAAFSAPGFFAVAFLSLMLAFPTTLMIGIPLLVAGVEPPSAVADYARLTWGVVFVGLIILVLVVRLSFYMSVGALALVGGILYLALIVSDAVQFHSWRVHTEALPLSRAILWMYALQVLAIVMTICSIVMGFVMMRADSLFGIA